MNTRFALLLLGSFLVAGLVQAAPHGIYPTQQQRAIYELLNPSYQANANQKLVYYGGPVLANVKVYAVFWGKNVNAAIQKQIGDYFSATVNSTYMDWLKEYNTNIKAVDGRAGTNQSLGRGTYGGAISIQPTHTSNKLNDTDIQAELDYQIDTQVLPKPDGNTLFMTYFPPGVSITIDGMASCQSFCAYHEGFVSKKYGNVFYGVMPDLGGACSWGCGFGHAQFDSVTSISSHELIEAVTDAFPTPGNSPAYPQAWNTTDGTEIGDLCAQYSTQLKTQGLTYVLQQEFDNATSACAPGPYHSP